MNLESINKRLFSKNNSGFTLVEILVVIAVITVVGIMITEIFLRSIRGSNKSQILGVIKQNGQAALDVLDKNIQTADNVVCPIVASTGTSGPSDILVIEKKGVYTRYRFTLPTSSSNGLIEQDNPTPQTQEESDNPAVFVSVICNPADPLISPIPLTDTNTYTGVSVTSGHFIRDKAAGFKDVVTVKFTVEPAINTPSAISSQIDPVPFSTTIKLR